MGPRALSSKRERSSDGPSSQQSTPAFDQAKILGAEQESQYAELASRNIWSERMFDINPQWDYRGCLTLIEGKNWHKLLTPPTDLDYEIVREFYSNALPIKGEGEECAYYKRVGRADWNIELIKEALIFTRRSYVVNALGVPVKFLRKDMNMNAQVIYNEIGMISSSDDRLGTRTLATLAFPGLIMGLCMHVGVAIPSVVHGTIEGVVNDRYFLKHCALRE
ncbi:hypothetical protein KIW84_045655 [Lathyrus oleraceus]|uniref:Uncharacterized protein n=1 Tax=Pisum sativum TaxID=3888 RepID=A0A9D5AUF2_PEA|nr:hypothetical protein KIW84_045655 [Pisum sativum]